MQFILWSWKHLAASGIYIELCIYIYILCIYIYSASTLVLGFGKQCIVICSPYSAHSMQAMSIV